MTRICSLWMRVVDGRCIFRRYVHYGVGDVFAGRYRYYVIGGLGERQHEREFASLQEAVQAIMDRRI